jgi:hypothetical protein
MWVKKNEAMNEVTSKNTKSLRIIDSWSVLSYHFQPCNVENTWVLFLFLTDVGSFCGKDEDTEGQRSGHILHILVIRNPLSNRLPGLPSPKMNLIPS